MKITIDLPEDIVAQTATQAWRSAFTDDYLRDSRRDGYIEVQKAVTAFLATPEVVTAIREAVIKSYKSQHEGIVRDVVSEELRKLVKKVVREQKDEGKLL